MTTKNLRDQIHQRARELLADGQWHDFEQIMRQLMPLVPAGIATRVVERGRTKGRADVSPPKRVKPMSVDEQIRSGQRGFVRDVLNYARFYEATPSKARGTRLDPDRRIRLTPGAPLPRSMTPGPITLLNDARARLREVEADNAALRADNDRLRRQVAELLHSGDHHAYQSDGLGGQCEGISPSLGHRCQMRATATAEDGKRYCRRHVGQGGGLRDTQPALPMAFNGGRGSSRQEGTSFDRKEPRR